MKLIGALMAAMLLLAGCAARQPPGTSAATVQPPTPFRSGTMIDTSGIFGKDFSLDEALRLLELCIDLNNPGNAKGYEADTSAWAPVYPSAAGAPADVLGPWQNAWKLWRSTTEANTYAIVIRGTISAKTSIIEDVLATSVARPAGLQAWSDGYLNFTLAQTPGAETHLGFTNGLAVLAFAQDKGILAQLANVPAGSRIYITGHSQGAAIAALLHAFLHYAINDPADRYGLKERNYSLKSYFFAQPKPGNWQFQMDFARIAASRGTSYAINNSRDWVTQVPLSVEFFDEPGGDMLAQLDQTAAAQGKTLRFEALKLAIRGAENVVRAAKLARADFADATMAHAILELQQSGGLLDPKWKTPGTAAVNPPESINYASAGNLVPVFGTDPCVPPGQTAPVSDPLCQHHLPVYRALMRAQLGP